VTADNSAASGNAITVNASNVSIDLNGHTLNCVTSSNSANGIYGSNRANLQVRNGLIGGFNHGVDLEAGTLAFGSGVAGIRFWKNQWAIYFNGSTGCVVQNCQFISGFVGVLFLNGSGNRATNNVASGLSYGFASEGTDYFDSNYADKCTFGIWAGSATTKFRFNTTTNCTTAVTGGTSEIYLDQ
jgi:parallel beta-helix repeat protein